MGTIGNQPRRMSGQFEDFRMGAMVEKVRDVAKSLRCSIETAVRVVEVAEYGRRTDFLIEDGDHKDEWVGGLNDTLREGIEQLAVPPS